MGNHGKPGLSVLAWARAHKRQVLGVAAGAFAIVSVFVPDFPGHEILTGLGSLLGG